MRDLQTEIEDELSWVVVGEIPGSELDFKVREAVRTVLTRHGIKPRRIIANSSPQGVDVQIQLPERAPRIEMVRVRFR